MTGSHRDESSVWSSTDDALDELVEVLLCEIGNDGVLGCVKALCVKKGSEISRREIEGYTALVGKFGLGGLGWMKNQETIAIT